MRRNIHKINELGYSRISTKSTFRGRFNTFLMCLICSYCDLTLLYEMLVLIWSKNWFPESGRFLAFRKGQVYTLSGQPASFCLLAYSPYSRYSYWVEIGSSLACLIQGLLKTHCRSRQRNQYWCGLCWLRKQRQHYSSNANIWDLSHHWTRYRKAIIVDLFDGHYISAPCEFMQC